MKEITKKWDFIWENYYEKLEYLSLAKKISISLLFALIIGISGQIYIKLPFTPVPLTLQVFFVLLSGILLGSNFSALSNIFYLLFGILGINWFFASSSGFFRPTTGYIIGFIFSSYFVGKYFFLRKSKIYSFLIMFSAVLIIYIFGCLFLSVFLKFNFKKTILLGVLPFIPFDLVKAYLAGIIGNSIMRNKRRNYERI